MENKQKKGKIFSNSIIYAASGLMLKCFSFFLLPLYTAYLTTEDYGITSIVSSFLTTASFIVAFSLYSAVMRFYVDLKNTPIRLKRFYGTMISFVFLISVLAVGVLALFQTVWVKTVFQEVDFFPVVFICIISLVFFSQLTIYENILKSQQKAKKYTAVSIAYFFMSLILNIVFVVILKKGAVGVLLANLISYFVYFIFFMGDLLVHKEIILCLDGGLLKEALSYSIPIMPHNLATQLAMLISKVLIGGSASVGIVGIYSIASQFGNIADTVQSYSDSAYEPWLFEVLKEQEDGYKNLIRKTSKVISAILGLFFIGIALFAQDYIVLFLNKSYVEAWKMIPLIVGVFVIKTMYYFYVGVLFYYKKASRLLFVATLSSSIINIFLSYFAIPRYGAYGSILADACAMIIRVGIIVIISKKYDDIGLRVSDFLIRDFVIMGFICLGLLFSYTIFDCEFNIVNFIYKIGIVIIYMITVYLQFKSEIRGYIKRRKESKKS